MFKDLQLMQPCKLSFINELWTVELPVARLRLRNCVSSELCLYSAGAVLALLRGGHVLARCGLTAMILAWYFDCCLTCLSKVHICKWHGVYLDD